MGKKGRIESFKEYILDTTTEIGLNIKHNHIDFLTDILNKQFILIQDKYLSTMTIFKDIIKNYIKINYNDVLIENDYIRYSFKINEISKIRLNTLKNKLTILEPSGKVDIDAMISAFNSIYVHSADAWIVYKYLDIIQQINNNLRDFYLEISRFTNYDNFGIPISYSPFLNLIKCLLDKEIFEILKQILYYKRKIDSKN